MRELPPASKIAAAATTQTLQQAEARAKAIAKEQEAADAAARLIADELAAAAIVSPPGRVRKGASSVSHGDRDIAEQLTSRTGKEVAHRQVLLEAPIKELGSYQVPG